MQTHTVTYAYIASVIILSDNYRSPLPVGSHIVNLDYSAACLQARHSSAVFVTPNTGAVPLPYVVMSSPELSALGETALWFMLL
jgi:hypothetical protein